MYQTLKRIVLGIGSLMLMGLGAHHLWFAMTTKAPTQMTCAALATAKPTTAWVTLKECELDLAEAMIHTRKDKVEGLVIPVRAAGSGGPTPIVLSVTDSDLLEKASAARKDDDKSGMGAMMLLVEVSRRVKEEEGITGVVSLMGSVSAKKLEGKTGIAANPVVVEFNQKPGMGIPLIMLFGGAIVLAYAFFLGKSPAEASAPALQPASR
jgi:hypothetical protein